MSIRVGIVGVSGYGGGEVLRLVATHPTFELVYVAGEGSAGQKLIERFPGAGKLGDLVIQGNDRTKDKVIRREAWMAGLVPGEVLNKNRMDLFKQRLGNLQYFHATTEMGKPIDIKIVNRRPKDKP